jgi:hypothetical protein
LELTPSQPTVRQLFREVYQYRVPRYQRPYAWEAGQIDEYWSDVSRVGATGHFLGPMVLHNPGGDDVRWVIDGQQRLTTLQMTIALIRDKYIELGDPPRKAGAPASMAPQALIRHVDYDDQFVLRSGVANKEVLEDFILRHPNDTKRKKLESRADLKTVSRDVWARSKRLVAARNRLAASLDTFLDSASATDPKLRLQALEELEDALVRRVSLVVLDLGSVDDAFLLFETLNDRGLRLSAADLLKSHLLSRLESDGASTAESIDEAADAWDEMVDELGGGDISAFLRHYLLMRAERVRKSDVFPMFKQEVTRVGAEVTLADVTVMGEIYGQLRSPSGDDKVSIAMRNLLGTGVDTHRVVLLPGRRWLEDALFLDLAQLVEVLSFRWSIVGLNAQVLETIYQGAAQTIASSQGADYANARATLLARVPRDREFADGFAKQNLGVQYVASYALRRIEDEFVPGERAIKSHSDVHVEHIMPRTVTEYWASRVGNDAYEDVVQRWGNLTLLLDKLNIQVSNGDWTTKRSGKFTESGELKHHGYDHSKINLTNDLTKVEEWNSSLIDLRARWMSLLACRVWTVAPGPSAASFPTFSSVSSNPSLLDDPYESDALTSPTRVDPGAEQADPPDDV